MYQYIYSYTYNYEYLLNTWIYQHVVFLFIMDRDKFMNIIANALWNVKKKHVIRGFRVTYPPWILLLKWRNCRAYLTSAFQTNSKVNVYFMSSLDSSESRCKRNSLHEMYYKIPTHENTFDDNFSPWNVDRKNLEDMSMFFGKQRDLLYRAILRDIFILIIPKFNPHL